MTVVADRARTRAVFRFVALTGSCLAALASSSALAQDESKVQEDQETQGRDIIVTAERRATNLQDTPLSILAVTSETVEAKGIEDLEDLSHFTPNLSITPTRGSGSSAASFVIRGIGGGGGATGERGVGLYVDGVFMPRTSGAVLRILDIDRIEVLRGPQGTLFGRNSTGGAIRIFSKQPTDHFEGWVEGTVGNFNHYDLVGMLNTPLGEGLAFRGEAAYLHKGGFVSRGTEKLGASEDIVARGQLRAEMGSDVTATLGLLYNRSHDNATPWVIKEFDMRPGIEGYIQGNYGDLLNDAFKAAGGAPLAAYNDPRIVQGNYAAPDVCLIDDFNPDYDPACNQFNRDKYWQVDLNLNWDLTDNVSVHSITGYAKLNHDAVTDWELIGAEMRYDFLRSKTFYQELQLNASLLEGAIDLVVGGSYFHENSSAPYNYVITRRTTSSYPATPGNPPNSDGGLYTRSVSDVFQKSDSYGLFGSATWHITPELNLTGGLRQAWDHKDYTQNRYQPAATTYQPVPDFRVQPGTTLSFATASQPFHALDWRGTLDYHITPDIMVYATVSKAYKAGSFSATLASGGPTDQSSVVSTIPNEKVVNYEGGFRMELFDRHLRINPTIFQMDYTDRQAAVRTNCGTGVLSALTPGSPQCPVGFLPLLSDQGDARIRGLEVDGQLFVVPGLVFDGSLGISDYKLKNVPVGTTHLYPDIPSPTYNIGMTYNHAAEVGDFTFNINYAYVGKQSVYPDDSADSGYILPSYDLVNARLKFEPTSLPVSIAAYVNNLLDKVYATYAQRFGGGFWDAGPPVGPAAPPRNALSVVRGHPREVGLSVKYEF